MFFENLKRLREKAGLTQDALARKLTVSLRSLQNWEQGHREPSIGLLEDIAAAVGATVDELVAGSGKGKRSKKRARGKA
jgi:transcriptional regulator with XRE-family HTH domain